MRRQASKAMSRLLARMQADRSMYPGTWNAAELAKVHAAKDRFDAALSMHHLFDDPPRRPGPMGQRIAKWRKSLRKLPAKLGLRAA
jgi:hypothetical protein